MTSTPTTSPAEQTRPGERIDQFLTGVETLPEGGKIVRTEGSVDALTDIAMLCRNALLTVAEVRSCVLSVRVLDLVLGHYNVPGVRAAAVTVLAMNKPAIRCNEQRLPISEWPDDAYSVGIVGTGAVDGTNWDGHLVLIVRGAGGRTMVDPSSGQFDRPQHGLHVPPVLVCPLPSLWTPHDPVHVELGHGTAIEYRQSTVKNWTETKDWNADRDLIRYVVAAVVEAVDSVRSR